MIVTSSTWIKSQPKNELGFKPLSFNVVLVSDNLKGWSVTTPPPSGPWEYIFLPSGLREEAVLCQRWLIVPSPYQRGQQKENSNCCLHSFWADTANECEKKDKHFVNRRGGQKRHFPTQMAGGYLRTVQKWGNSLKKRKQQAYCSRSNACCLFLCVSMDMDASGEGRERGLLGYCQHGLQRKNVQAHRDQRYRRRALNPAEQQPETPLFWEIRKNLIFICVFVLSHIPTRVHM